MTRTHVITGATGLVGAALLLEIAHRDDTARLLCPLRETGLQGVERLHRMIRTSAAAYVIRPESVEGILRRTEALPGFDFSRDLPPVPGPAPHGPVHFWHSAARMVFREDQRRAQFAANTAGGRRALDLARALDADAFTMISTAYVAGTTEGVVREEPITMANSRNPYERSKISAERLLLNTAQDLDVRVLRPSIITGHSTSLHYPGTPTGAFATQGVIAAFHRALPAQRRTEQRQVVALPDEPINLVPIDHVVREAVDIALHSNSTGIHHLTNPAPPTVRTLLDACFANAAGAPPRYVDSPAALDRYDRMLHDMLTLLRPYLITRQHFERSRTDRAVRAPARSAWTPSPATLRAMLAPFADRPVPRTQAATRAERVAI
ncbi:SDR family oxidoreductase [Kitasatospora cineracea]|uniref:SDR family oxidoreductase n=1 Tax=Kitasatospora cineracea TaxID=88074 RepID=UPI0037A66F75